MGHQISQLGGILKEVLRDHIASGADITCVCTEDLGSSNDVYFSLDASDRITDVAIERQMMEFFTLPRMSQPSEMRELTQPPAGSM